MFNTLEFNFSAKSGTGPSRLPQGSWVSRADCASTDPDALFPEPGQAVAAAKKVCAGCPVRTDCLDWAMSTAEHHGIWGGLTASERNLIRRGARMGDVA